MHKLWFVVFGSYGPNVKNHKESQGNLGDEIRDYQSTYTFFNLLAPEFYI